MAKLRTLQFYRGTAAEWTSADPTLEAGEPGFETDTNKIKIGDGVTAWTSLAYLTGGGAGDMLASTYDPATIAEQLVGLTATQTLTNKTLTGADITDYTDFTPVAAPAHTEGRVFYDTSKNALSYYNDEADVTINMGQETVIRVRNTTGSTITNGQAVYVSGAAGANLPLVSLAQADALATARCIGLATHDIENNSNGYITTLGSVGDLDTSSFTAGNPLFLSTTVAGGLTETRPTTGFAVVVGYTTISNVSTGEIKVIPGTTAQESTILSDIVEDTTPQLGGDLDLNGNEITNVTSIAVNQVAHGFSVGDAIKHNGTSFTEAQGTSVSTAGTIGVVKEVVDADNFTYQFKGLFTSGSWTNGTDYFLSVSTAGLISTEPTYSAGNVRQFIGRGVPGGLLLEIAEGDEMIYEAIVIECSDETTALTTGTAKRTFRMPYPFSVSEVRASLTTAGSTSGTTTIDINEGGVSILSTKLTIDFGEKTSTTAATAAVISDSSIADDAEITIDIDAVTGGADETGLKVYIIGAHA